jgi:hypothetical protein
VDLQHGLRHAQLVLAWREVVVDERAGQNRLAGVAGGQLDPGLAELVLRLAEAGPVALDVRAPAPGAAG